MRRLTETLSAALATVLETVEDHEAWRNTLILKFRSVEIVAIVIIFLIGTVAFAAIVFTTRSVLAVHQEIVEVLHPIYAHDNMAAQFQKHTSSH